MIGHVHKSAFLHRETRVSQGTCAKLYPRFFSVGDGEDDWGIDPQESGFHCLKGPPPIWKRAKKGVLNFKVGVHVNILIIIFNRNQTVRTILARDANSPESQQFSASRWVFATGQRNALIKIVLNFWIPLGYF